MTSISSRLRQAVIERARGRCEYCLTQQVVVIVMDIDHIIPVSVGGQTVLDNLCLACPTCNIYKSDHQTGYDPETKSECSLFNPRIDTWADHFAWSENGLYLLGRTPVGRATIERLHMNEPAVIEARRRWIEIGWHPPT